MASNVLCMSIYQCVIILLTNPIHISTMVHFDTGEIPDNSELIPMKISNVLTQVQDRNYNENSRPGNVDFDPMPVQMEVDLVCKGNPIHPDLHFHDNSNHNTQHISSFNSTMEEMPVFTKSHNSNNIKLDNFPRLYTRSCRTFRDSKSQAAFLVIRDPIFSSFKFFGSFAMGNTQYFVQPYIGTGSNETTRLHVSTEIPQVDFSDDGEIVSVRNHERKGKNVVSKLIQHQPFHPRQATKSQSQGMEQSFTSHEQQSLDHNDIVSNVNSLKRGDQQTRIEQTGQSESEGYTAAYPPNRSRDLYSPNLKDADNVTRKRKLRKRQKNSEKKSFNESLDPNIKQNLHREKRQAISIYTVEIVIVCDFLCYRDFQATYSLSDEVQTKNVISLFFSYIREQYQISYSSVLDLYPEFQTSIEIKIPALYIATTSDEKIIGSYILEEGTDIVDSGPSLFEFAIWVQDSLKVSLKADHYALVTGYDLYFGRYLRGVIGQVTRIPRICDIDSASINEFIPALLSILVNHELGHSLGAEHDSLTGGVCTDDDQFIMTAAIRGLVETANEGNPFRFSPCSAAFFASTLPTKPCLQRDDFNTSTLPDEVPLLGQQISLDEQCRLLGQNSTLCRNITVAREGSWDTVCSTKFCEFNERCGPALPSFQYTSCGNKRWCEAGLCVDNPNAPEKPVDCPAGDSLRVVCDVFKCNTYSDFIRFVECCETYRPLRTERFVIIQ